MSADDAPPSRTQRKREALALQNAGARLVDLTPAELDHIPLPEELAEAVRAARGIRAHGGRRRQLQFIGKLMRRLDAGPILEALAELDGSSARERYEFHQLERWRERLLEDPAALTEYLHTHPHADRQRLRHQLARVRRAGSETLLRKESRALFRLLREFEDTGD
jgi:ribosome-associated protein